MSARQLQRRPNPNGKVLTAKEKLAGNGTSARGSSSWTAKRKGALVSGLLVLLLIYFAWHQTPKPCDPAWTESEALVCAGSAKPLPAEIPVDLDEMIDMSSGRGDRSVVDRIVAQAMAATDMVIAHGGRIVVRGFSADAPHAVPIVQARVPTLDELRDTQRGTMSANVHAEIESAIRKVLERRLVAPGSDVSGAFGVLGTVERTPDSVLAAIVVSDGRDYQKGRFSLVKEMEKSQRHAEALLERRLQIPANPPAAIALVGVNLLGGAEDINADQTRQLVAVWTAALKNVMKKSRSMVTASA